MLLLRKCFPIIARRINSKPRPGRIRSAVERAFSTHLYWTNVLSSGMLMFFGDFVQQEHEYRQKLKKKPSTRYDYGRLSRMFVTGLILGPFQHYFYLLLGHRYPAKDVKTATKKILLDQILMSPLSISIFFYSMCAMEMKTFDMCTEEFLNKFIQIYLVDWCVCPATQMINFLYVPVKFQVLYVNSVTMFYNVYLSYVKHN